MMNILKPLQRRMDGIMDKRKLELIGSPTRDKFKQKHKILDNRLYACDIDFIFVSKYPPKIVGILDLKTGRDNISFSEVIAYNNLKDLGIDIYIAYTNDDNKMSEGRFDIYKYISGDFKPNPPDVKIFLVSSCNSWEDFEKWEKSIRSLEGVKTELDKEGREIKEEYTDRELLSFNQLRHLASFFA